MYTRSKTTAREQELKLTVALKELKTSRELCQRLLQEREDSEVEVKKVVDKNTQLKEQLSDLDIQYMDVVDQRDKLKIIINSFNECSKTHELSLDRITYLEAELVLSKTLVSKLKQDIECIQTNKNQSLFDELLCVNSPVVNSVLPRVTPNLSTIDLTGEDSINQIVSGTNNNSTCSYYPNLLSKNKFRKYKKIRKLITKTKKNLKINKCYINNVKLRMDRTNLIEELELCTKRMKESQTMYDSDTHQLYTEISKLEKLLFDCNAKYQLAQKENSEHILAASELVELCTYNAERFDSLMNNHCCTCVSPSVRFDSQPSSPSLLVSMPAVINNDQCDNIINQCTPTRKTFVFSDKIGVGLGAIFSKQLDGTVLNYCMPGASYQQIVTKILSTKFDDQSTIVLLIGSSLGVRKRHIINCFEVLSSLKVFNILVCAFPYSISLSQKENNYIYSLNNLVQTLTYHYNLFSFFDTNSFIGSFRLTKDTMYLSKKFRIKIATLVVYCINSVISNITKSSFNNDSTDLSNVTKNTVVRNLN